MSKRKKRTDAPNISTNVTTTTTWTWKIPKTPSFKVGDPVRSLSPYAFPGELEVVLAEPDGLDRIVVSRSAGEAGLVYVIQSQKHLVAAITPCTCCCHAQPHVHSWADVAEQPS